MNNDFYTQPLPVVFAKLRTNERGLSAEEAARRLKEYGPNKLPEGKAQNTLLALKRFVETKATVLRDGKEIITSDIEIVPCDIIILQEGERVPADARIMLSQNLKVDEAALTGESEQVHKIADALDSDASVDEQRNMIFKGTHIVAGNGRAVVTRN